MAVKAKAPAAKKAAKKPAGLGINDLAKEMKLEPASVRVKLRNAEIKRSGRGYSFASPAEVKRIAKQLSAS